MFLIKYLSLQTNLLWTDSILNPIFRAWLSTLFLAIVQRDQALFGLDHVLEYESLLYQMMLEQRQYPRSLSLSLRDAILLHLLQSLQYMLYTWPGRSYLPTDRWDNKFSPAQGLPFLAVCFIISKLHTLTCPLWSFTLGLASRWQTSQTVKTQWSVENCLAGDTSAQMTFIQFWFNWLKKMQFLDCILSKA